MDVILYGANGFTGKLVAQSLKAQGIETLLSGRNKTALEALSSELNLPFATCDLNHLDDLFTRNKDVKILINAAGPFIYTAEVVARACIRHKVHYVDITGEIPVFELLEKLNSAATKAGIMILPGAGFDVVPTDCLANHLKKLLPEAHTLEIAFGGLGGGVSRGTALTAITHMQSGTWVRENGELKRIKWGSRTKSFHFNGKLRTCEPIPWGDLQTAWQSTGIPNISVYIPFSSKNVKFLNAFGSLLTKKWVKKWIKSYIAKKIIGPTEEQQKSGMVHITGTALAHNNLQVRHSFSTREGYTFTAQSATKVAQLILDGHYKIGYQTPGMAYGWRLMEDLII